MRIFLWIVDGVLYAIIVIVALLLGSYLLALTGVLDPVLLRLIFWAIGG